GAGYSSGMAKEVVAEPEQKLPRGARRRMRTQQMLLDAAEKLFRQSMTPDVRVEDIADAAQVSVGSLYMHFGNKNGLITGVARRVLARGITRLDDAVEGLESPVDKLTATGFAYARLLVENPFISHYLSVGSFVSQLGDFNEVMRSELDRMRDRVT